MTSFEQAFIDTERAASGAVTASAALLKVAKELEKAAQEGDIARIRRACERLGVASQAVRQQVVNAQSAWPMTPDDEEKALDQVFDDELIEAAREQGISIRRQDDRLVVFPSLLRVLPSRRAVEIDRKAVTAIRPSRLVRLLKANSDKKPRSSPERFIEVLPRRLHRHRPWAGGCDLRRLSRRPNAYAGRSKGVHSGRLRARPLLSRPKRQNGNEVRRAYVTSRSDRNQSGAKVFSFVAPDAVKL